MKLSTYLKNVDAILKEKAQRSWFAKLENAVEYNLLLYKGFSDKVKRRLQDEFLNRVRTEEIKAWYSEPQGNSLFQGTSISSLTVPKEFKNPLELTSIIEIEESIADSYIELHYRYAKTVKNTIIENVDGWIKEGLYYGVVLSSKLISQAFGLAASYEDVVFKVEGRLVDPHEITSYPDDIRRFYFKKALKSLTVFEGLELEQKELESSLVLADISKPKIKKFKDKILLAPVRCNEIAAVLSERITRIITKKSSGKIKPRSLAVIIFDTDTPYTYHQVMDYYRGGFSPVLPGLIVLGSSGTIDAFRWLYAYRVSLIAQKIMKSSLYSQVHRCFVPYVFLGVLVPRDAQILLEMDNLHRLRYRGNIDPGIEFAYLIKNYLELLHTNNSDFSKEGIFKRALNSDKG